MTVDVTDPTDKAHLEAPVYRAGPVLWMKKTCSVVGLTRY